MTMVETIEIKKESPYWDDHLFVDDKGKFGWKAGSWEKTVLEAEMQRTSFAGFFRNMPRKAWALCVPYGSENDQALFPDILVFRRNNKRIHIDVLEPHGDQFADHLPKAQGLAHYAKNHSESFGRIELIRLVKGKPERLDMQDDKVRGKVLNGPRVGPKAWL
jgi:type III restriction enzyme